MKRNHKRMLVGLLFLIIVVLIYSQASTVERWMYPIRYKTDIELSAQANNLNPHLVAAIIRAESNYQPHLVSKKGAVGLMQLMPQTAEWAASKIGVEYPVTGQTLHRPDVNIEIGSWYVSSLRRQFNENEVAMIAAYNAGPSNVRSWLNEQRWDGQMDSVNDIPFGETRHYVQKVAYYYDKYERLYGSGKTLQHVNATLE